MSKVAGCRHLRPHRKHLAACRLIFRGGGVMRMLAGGGTGALVSKLSMRWPGWMVVAVKGEGPAGKAAA